MAVMSPDLPRILLRRVVCLNVVWVGASIALSWYYRVPPPLISGIVLEVPLIGALVARELRRGTE